MVPFFSALYSIIVYFFFSDPFSGLRSVIGYLTLFVASFLGYRTFVTLRPRVVVFVILVYSLFGFVQTFIFKEFGAFMLPRLSTSTERGITSLTVEPSQYAITCVFLILLLDMLRDAGKMSNSPLLCLKLLLFFQVFLTFSGMGLLLLLMYGLCRLCLRASFPKLVLGSLGAFLSILFLMRTPFAETRGGRLISLLMTHGFAIVNIDRWQS